jgi:signal transduction histidine kinase/ligand-binding sensor domain-containing protein
LGTAAGLVSFDGAEFSVVGSSSTPGFGDGGASRLAAAPDGTLFVGTTSGAVLHYANGTFTQLVLRAGTAYVSSLLAAKDGSVWIGVPGTDTVRWFRGQRHSFPGIHGLQAPFALAEDEHGGIWIGTRRRGLVRYVDGLLSQYEVTQDVIQALCFDRSGTLWIGTAHGLLKFRDGRIERLTQSEGLSHDSVSALLCDRDGNLWAGTAGGGLNRLTHGRWTHFGSLDGLTDDDVRCLLEDHEGNLWVGTADGLNCLSEGRFVTYGHLEGLKDTAVSAVAVARKGGVWLGLASGAVARLTDGAVQRFPLPAGLGREAVRALYETRDGSLWIVQDNGRVFRMRDGAAVEETPIHPGTNEAIGVITEDERGPVFLASMLGPARLENRRLVPMHPQTPRAGYIRYPHAALWDGHGGLWVCDLRGLAHLDAQGGWTMLTTREGLPRNRARSAILDADGALWVATAGGLAYVKGDRIHSATIEHGLPENYLRVVLDDGLGHLWVASMGRIFRLEKRELLDLFAGRIQRVRPILFDSSDGLRTTEGLLGNGPGVRTADGRLWFATAKGASVIDPSHITVDEPAPPTTLQRWSIDGRGGSMGGEYPPGRGEVTIEYTALSYRAAGKVRFRHRLSGLDPDWVEAGTARKAYYSSLPPGHYRFSVMAANRDGLWNGEEASLSFTIRPPFYRTPLFFLACAAAVLGLGAAVHRLRMGRVRAHFSAVVHERTRIARELHDTLAQGLAGVKLHIDAATSALVERPEVARRSLQCARSIATSSLSEVRRSIWVLRAQSAKGEDALSSSLPASLRHLTEDSGLRVSVRVEGPARRLPAEVERNLLRIAHEAVTNAVRHSGARALEVHLRFEAGAVCLVVRDDGRGFEPEAFLRGPRGEHFGLIGMQERALLARGDLDIHSRPGAGTTILCRLPDDGEPGPAETPEASEGASP